MATLLPYLAVLPEEKKMLKRFILAIHFHLNVPSGSPLQMKKKKPFLCCVLDTFLSTTKKNLEISPIIAFRLDIYQSWRKNSTNPRDIPPRTASVIYQLKC